jgi:anaerobic sulfite reductase subunit B
LSDVWTPVPYVVSTRQGEVDATATLLLLPTGPDVLPVPVPGQFHMLWAFGVGEAPISVSAIPAAGQVHTVRAVGAVSAALAAAEPGTVLGVRGPFGRGWDLSGLGDRHVVIVAGGLGLAPLRPAIDVAAARPEGRTTVVVGSRSPEALLFPVDLDRWAAAGVEVVRTVDAPSRAWSGEVGLVTSVLPRVVPTPEAALALVCGPEVMMRFTADALVDLGLDPTDVQVSLERNMQCAVGHCGRCQLGPDFLCQDGPVFTWAHLGDRLKVAQL